MKFEDKKFCSIATLSERWEVGKSLIYDLVAEGRLQAWHPRGAQTKGLRISVESVLIAEEDGFIEIDKS